VVLPRGTQVLSDVADHVYQVTNHYDGTDQCAVASDDPDLGVPSPISEPILSARDRFNPTLYEVLPSANQRAGRRVGSAKLVA
jgi:dTDP-4-dehydrorhamnose 3,5-epimerase